jgi:hypothetical protein
MSETYSIVKPKRRKIAHLEKAIILLTDAISCIEAVGFTIKKLVERRKSVIKS